MDLDENTRVVLLIDNAIDSIPGNNYQDKLNYLNTCNCCERHKNNKPSLFTFWTETQQNTDYTIRNCRCNCRHVSRIICRQYETPNVIVTPTPPSSP